MDPSVRHEIGPKGEVLLREDDLRRQAEAALMEDRAWQDITTDTLVPDDQEGRAVLLAKETGVLAGLPMARMVFRAVPVPFFNGLLGACFVNWDKNPLNIMGAHKSAGH